jgi:glycosyltransferase involved in cell wall biosynthesis
MRLGFHYHIPAIEQKGKVWMPGYLGLFIDSLAARCEQVVCFQHSPYACELDQMDYPIKSDNVRLVSLGEHSTIPLRTMQAVASRQIFNKWRDELDVMLIRAATPLLPVVASNWHKPIVLMVVSDAVIGIENLPQPAWRKQLIRIWASWNRNQQLRVAKRSLTFVNSRVLYDQLYSQVHNLVETRTTTLSENDFYERTDTCGSTPYRLLYAGRMARIKGLCEIVEALSELVASGIDVVLDLVGMPEKGDAILEELSTLARSLGVSERVQYHGYKTAGPELLAYYRRADIYVIASQSSSEGFPRTIWEAMASSLPVVATRVGSIPAYASNAAVLVPPKDVSALTQDIKDLLGRPDLRQNLIRQGMALARTNTLEKQAEKMMSRIEHWIESGSPSFARSSKKTYLTEMLARLIG